MKIKFSKAPGEYVEYEEHQVISATEQEDERWIFKVMDKNLQFNETMSSNDMFRLKARLIRLKREPMFKMIPLNPLIKWLAKGSCY